MSIKYEMAKLRTAGFGQGGEGGGGENNSFFNFSHKTSEAVGGMAVAVEYGNVSLEQGIDALRRLNNIRKNSSLSDTTSRDEIQGLLRIVALSAHNSARADQAVRQILSGARIEVGSEGYNDLFRAVEGEMSRIMNDGMSPSNALVDRFQEQVQYFSLDRQPDGFQQWSLLDQQQWHKERGENMAGKPTEFGVPSVPSSGGGFFAKLFGRK